MIRRARTAVGIDVCCDRVYLSVMARDARGTKTLRSVSAPLPEGTLQNGDLAEMETLTRTLRKLRRRAHIHRARAAVAMSISPLVLRFLDMPDPLPANVGAFVENELQQYVALSGRKIVSDFQAIGGAARKLLAVSTEAQIIRKLAKACEAAGLTVEAAEPSILAYVRAIHQDEAVHARSGNRLVVEVNEYNLSACHLRKGVLEAVRIKNRPTEANDSGYLSDWLVEEIEAMVRYYGLDAPTSGLPSEVKVILRDAALAMPETVARLRMGIETSALHVRYADGSDVETTTGPAEVPCDRPSKVTQGLGTKLLDSAGDPWRVNLLPNDIRQTRSLVKHALVSSNIAALIFLAMMGSLQLITGSADKMRRDLEQTKSAQKLYSTTALVARAGSMDQQIRSAEARVRKMRNVLGQHNPVDWSSVLRIVGESTPTDVCVTELGSNDSRALTLQGLALSYEAAQTFAQGLKARDYFKSVSLAKAEKQSGTGAPVRYEIDCALPIAR